MPVCRNRLSKNLEGTLHGFVVEVEQGKLVASFPPRSVVHIPVKHSKKPWYVHVIHACSDWVGPVVAHVLDSKSKLCTWENI